ncbi:MAG: aminopeptidase P family protein [Reichenbachiella sp.]|uniref:aminopeptidase P family protein n=1 Tax=Reichenbachiella sp. TaxID=2184521 RepID=UPI0029669583|nr:aminopeptidase P family protein [Reichenbachiella sp.]MDW3211977.1 aminopeptidase P family protein [Reichenbachiella sp.]
MKYTPLDKEVYINNRNEFRKHLTSDSVAIFNSNDIMPTSADGVMPFKQNTDVLHLTGIDQEETILVLRSDFPDPALREILFIRETNDLIAVWEGHKFTKDEARALSGVENVQWLSEFDRLFNDLATASQTIYINANEHTRAMLDVETRDDRFSKWCHEKYPNHKYRRSAPIMHHIRSAKSDQEIQMLQVACDITNDGFRRILKFVKPGVAEYEIEAEFIHEFVRQKSKGFAYAPIIASGGDSCILHYVENKKKCLDGDILLMDVAAEYGNYNADMTRSIPVNGRFSKRQKEVYQAVHRVKSEATNMLRPGVILADFNKEVGLVMEKELLKLGLIDQTDIKNQHPDQPAYSKYFVHNTSHFLGLDVHDVGSFYKPVRSGTVVTVEPGIYIPEENLGIRLEDNIVIQENGNLNLMKDIPLDLDEIETLMNE